jgi:hypothetical protein
LSGDDMTPLFQDGVRDQIIINLMETGYPADMVWSLHTDAWADLVRMGQEEALAFLTTGVTRNPALVTRCPVGARVHNNVCE